MIYIPKGAAEEPYPSHTHALVLRNPYSHHFPSSLYIIIFCASLLNYNLKPFEASIDPSLSSLCSVCPSVVRMGDRETVVAQTSTVTGYTSADYDTSSAAIPDAAGNETGASGDLASSIASKDAAHAMSDDSNLWDEGTYATHSDSVMQEAPASTTYVTNPSVGATDGSVTQPGLENAAANMSQVSGFDSTVNGNVASEATNLTLAENGTSPGDADGVTAEQHFEDGSVPGISAEEDRWWSIVRVNSSDFNAWTALIEETEKVAENNISKIRRVYDAFLEEFPLCYGYWKKYADHEVHLGSMEKVVEVYERAVQGVTYSVDIWLHYSTFTISTYGDPDTIRRQFERGLAYVGTDYLSYPLWDKYIEYEYTQQDWSRLAMIYTRILENPNQQLDRYFNSFKELAVSRPLSELRTAEEAAMAASLLEAGGQEIEGEVHPDALEQSPTPVSAGLTESEDLEKYIAIREEMYKKAKEFDSKIIGFETAIRRPYFHVRPLNVAELENWHNYLDFIEREADINKIVKLYERCLIACANYPEYWIRYVLCMETSGSMDLANNALARATQVFVKRQPEIHLFDARFKEHTGDLPGARAAYQLVHSEISPGLLDAIIKHANMEHRLGNMEDAVSIYEQAIAIEKGKEHSQRLAMVFAQYSRFVFMVLGNAEKARDILAEALEHVQLSKPLLEALIHLESIQSLPKRIDYVDSLVEKFVVPSLDSANLASAAEREELSCIFLEFLDLFGDTQSIKKADDRHAKHFLHHRSSSELRKRHAEDFLASDKAKLAKSYSVAPSPGQSVMGAYPAAPNQWATGYNLQPQALPQISQAQGQQWNAGYSQQGAYSGYGSAYSNPQIPTSVPQTASYVSYPQTYPVQQAFPQQSYAQPAAVTAAVPVQQPASVPQGYYGSYY